MGLLVFPQQNTLQIGNPIVSAGGGPTRDLYYLLLAFFNRTGQGTGAPTIDIGLAAIAVPGVVPIIAADWNEFDTVPAGGIAQIPQVAVGSDFIVWNFGANNLAVTPQPNVQIDALGSGGAYTLVPNKMQWFRCTAPNQIRSTQLG